MPRPAPLRDRAAIWYLVSYLLDDASERLVWSRRETVHRAGRVLGHLSDHAARLSLPLDRREIDWDAPVSAETLALVAELKAQAAAAGFAE